MIVLQKFARFGAIIFLKLMRISVMLSGRGAILLFMDLLML